ncbi:MAG: hypothetical protein OXI87_14410 [Albidovulum sp.]|nr:hypothetical protein [Albidovulum sp.]
MATRTASISSQPLVRFGGDDSALSIENVEGTDFQSTLEAGDRELADTGALYYNLASLSRSECAAVAT